jgi:asparagine synthase (glutamine-hydrolysing)
MCGFVGIFNLNRETHNYTDSILHMTEEINYRGPDDEGYLFITDTESTIFKGDNTPNYNKTDEITYFPSQHIKNTDIKAEIAFGFRRLSIHDLSISGHQPMSYISRYWIVFNGEIYNYPELKDELTRFGYTFKSNTDTEVIMASYDKWGKNCLNKFNGMWAFILYDIKLKILFVSRDRFGIKPLNYYIDKNVLIFSSEIKSILKFPGVNTTPNVNYLKDYLKTGGKEHIKDTAFKNIFRFNFASYVEQSFNDIKNVGIKEKEFWNLKINLSREKYDDIKAIDYANNYYKLLINSTKLRLRADVKVGSALSGGLDSSSIVYSINQLLKAENKNNRQETFSCVYLEKATNKLDESRYINEIVDFLNVASKKIEPDTDNIIKDYSRMIYAMDNPPNDSVMSGWHVYKLVAETDIKVMLDGQGADEQQGGYLKYIPNYFIDLPVSYLFPEYKLFKMIPGISKHTLKLCVLLNIFKRIFSRKAVFHLLKWLGKNYQMSYSLNEILKCDMTNNLVKLLHYGDRISMAHSIESRAPFMDYRLVEFTASIPLVYKLHGGWTKYFARLAMKNKLPDNLTWRKDKMSFPNADEYWFKDKLKEWCCSKIESSELLKKLNIGQNIRNEISVISVENLMRLLNLSIWDKVFWNKKEI